MKIKYNESHVLDMNEHDDKDENRLYWSMEY